jgi:hypothetical protein
LLEVCEALDEVVVTLPVRLMEAPIDELSTCTDSTAYRYNIFF